MGHELTLNSRHLHNLLEASYAGTAEARKIALQNGYVMDEELSDRKQRVFRDKHDNSIIAFTGTRTFGDVMTDAALAVGLEDLTYRFTNSTKLAEKVKEKYHHSPIIAIGHSLGGSLAEHVNESGVIDKVITVNKGTGLGGIGKNINFNQTDIRTATDPVSFLATTQTGGKRFTVPDSFVVRPLRSHATYNIKKFDKKQRF